MSTPLRSGTTKLITVVAEITGSHAAVDEFGEPDTTPESKWNDAQRSLFVDSLWNNYPVPHIVFHIVQTPKGQALRCIDGKERLKAIQRSSSFTYLAVILTLPAFTDLWMEHCHGTIHAPRSASPGGIIHVQG
ncbi:hypothetical protein K435DRAFT_860801 [Dendrothele bispora CBS 962.96]|uniref:Uncharacterized protein n=1 Tax=Dendrothele bispora (strain CBS 962.96) TaxID=1314807 RepID=A0A4S8LX03_DENBC|nr:hypothetical protein K435DRAFT_860801 [Dendrothele bispora CBS 962.96]